MVSPTIQKIILILVTLALLGFLGYRSFTSDEVAVLDTGFITGGGSESEMVGQDILNLVDKFKKISFDKEFFTSALFYNLRDLSQTIFPEARGRANPFAVIGFDTFFVTTPTQTPTQTQVAPPTGTQ